MNPDHVTARNQLESLYNEKVAQRPRVTLWSKIIRPVVSDWGSAILKFLLGSHDPVISERVDKNGQGIYEIYDPITRDRMICHSEQEVRAWLEQRYYQ